ncbi:MAG TPA: hypothetical protein VJM49_10915, partial [Acidimicrobiales bacterium]|nr:hypothetical protein [Acidimicrobiales bacterium]
ARRPDHAWRGSVRLELRWFAPATVVRLGTTAAGVAAGLAGGPPALVFLALALGEGLGRWLFFVTVVPLNMPGSFFRGTTAHPRSAGAPVRARERDATGGRA